MNQRTLSRSVKKAQGFLLRKGPPLGFTGEPKGPRRTPSLHEMLEAKRAAHRRSTARQPLRLVP